MLRKNALEAFKNYVRDSDNPSFTDVDGFFARTHLYTTEEAMEIIEAGTLDAYLKSEPILSSVCRENQKNSDQLIEKLYTRGANIDFQDGFGQTALHTAARNGNALAVNTLLTLGARILKDGEGNSPLAEVLLYTLNKPGRWGSYSWIVNWDERAIQLATAKSIVDTLISHGCNLGKNPVWRYCVDEELRGYTQRRLNQVEQNKLKLFSEKPAASKEAKPREEAEESLVAAPKASLSIGI